MLFSKPIALLALAASAQAFNLIPRQNSTDGSDASAESRSKCPAVWTTISKELTAIFVAGGQCTDDARAAIRAVFHDCFPQGGCDGSLAIPEELARKDNVPMTATVNKLKALATKYNVGVADILMFAGSHATISCPGGPTTKTYIGRVDATAPAPDGQLPAANVSGNDALSHFQSKGFSAQDLAALIGAHTSAKQFNTDPARAGAPEDATPGIWDILYYMQTIIRTAPFTFQSDINLVNQNQVGPWMRRFSVDKGGWDASFAAAMAKMELLGTKGAGAMTDCTSALPRSFAMRSAKPNFARSILNSIAMARKMR